jgi:hypothetical protein
VIEDFQNALANIESKGCLRSDEDYRVRRALAESLPLPPPLAHELQMGSYGRTGFIDLTSDFRLDVTSPIYAPGSPQSAGNLIGHETAYYSFAGPQGDDRIRISPASVTEEDLGRPPVNKAASQNFFSFYPSYGYFRLLFRAEQMESSSITRAVLLAAGDKTDVSEATGEIQSGLADLCQAVAVPRVNCVAFPPGFAVNAEFSVIANGKQTFVLATEATISGLIDVNPPPKTLRLKRRFQGRLVPVLFDPAVNNLRSFALMPGDKISW